MRLWPRSGRRDGSGRGDGGGGASGHAASPVRASTGTFVTLEIASSVDDGGDFVSPRSTLRTPSLPRPAAIEARRADRPRSDSARFRFATSFESASIENGLPHWTRKTAGRLRILVAWSLNPHSRVQEGDMSETRIPPTLLLRGKTYPHRDTIRARGGRWDASASAWRVPASVWRARGAPRGVESRSRGVPVRRRR